MIHVSALDYYLNYYMSTPIVLNSYYYVHNMFMICPLYSEDNFILYIYIYIHDIIFLNSHISSSIIYISTTIIYPYAFP